MLLMAIAELAVFSFFITVLLIVSGGLLVLGLFAFWLWMLIHALRNPGLTDGERVAWTVVICLTHLLGALLYLFLGRSKAKQSAVSPSPMSMPAPGTSAATPLGPRPPGSSVAPPGPACSSGQP